MINSYPCTLHNLPLQDVQFDVAVAYNVINHVDEEAVETLHCDETMRARYVELVEDLRSKIRLGGSVIIADCADRICGLHSVFRHLSRTPLNGRNIRIPLCGLTFSRKLVSRKQVADGRQFILLVSCPAIFWQIT
jgi:hypothetical protein